MTTDRRAPAAPALLALGLLAAGCAPAQIGPDRDASKAVDALYTAISLRDPRLLASSTARLRSLRASGQLPPAASDALAPIVAEAEAGAWPSALDRLGAFMAGQGRAGP